jgi:hypothetical protein
MTQVRPELMQFPTGRKALLAAGAFGGGIVLAVLVFREPTKPLARTALDAAHSRWAAAAIRDYDVAYRMHGALYEVEVRDGTVVRAVVNGLRSTSPDWEAYSIDGLFAILELELAGVEPPGGTASSIQAPLMRVRFHKELGYPERYLRAATGLSRAASVELVSFVRR